MATFTHNMKKQVRIRFYEELNDFLQPRNRKVTIDLVTNGKTTVKDLIESLGVPHTEVDLILVNGNSVAFSYVPDAGDLISVYPVFESLEIENVTRLRPKPLRNTKFILDVHLGKLTRKLRMLGFDTLYRNDYADDEIIEIALAEKRIILTRDVGILKNKLVTHGYFVKSTQPARQIEEVIGRFDLSGRIRPLSRCIECNGTIVAVSKREIDNLLQPKTKRYFDAFFRCMDCRKIYWEGSHYTKMLDKIVQLQSNQ
jgi:uncharacterized protein